MQIPVSLVYNHQEFSIKSEFNILNATLYIVTKDWKQPKYSSVGAKLNKLWHFIQWNTI